MPVLDDKLGKFLCIGVGAMGSALVSGVLASGNLSPQNITVVDTHAAKLEPFTQAGCHAETDLAKLDLASFDSVLLAIKPQAFDAVLSELGQKFENALVISIAAGLTTKTVQSYFGDSIRVVRVMPNIPATKRLGAAAVCKSETATDADIDAALGFFSQVGTAVEVDEDKMDIVGVISGSSPAFFAYFIDVFTQYAIQYGLPAATARDLIAQTMEGTARMIREDNMHPRDFIEKVTSPGGTTIAGMLKLEDCREVIGKTVKATYKRSRKLAGKED